MQDLQTHTDSLFTIYNSNNTACIYDLVLYSIIKDLFEHNSKVSHSFSFGLPFISRKFIL